jgi:molybdopterin-guanine dinucleotide biosynthesis protein A
MPTPSFSAILLAAGHSTRMGRDKALLEFEGAPLWRRQRDTLAAAGAAEIFLSARPGQEWVRGIPGFTAVVHDALSTGGPIVGVTAGLERATHPWLAVLAIDLPAMTPAWFTSRLREVAPGVGVVGRRGEFFEPLAAIYPVELRWLAWEALARGEFSLQRLLGAAVAQGLMRVREIADEEAAWFENWNEPRPHSPTQD